MKAIVRGAFAAAVFLTIAAADARAADVKPTGTVEKFAVAPAPKPAGDFTWRGPDGKDVTLKSYTGKTVVMNFWATWCAPCIVELPSLQRLQEKLGAAPIVVIALNIDRGSDGADKARAMLKRLKLDGLAFHHDSQSQAYRTLGIQVMPTTVVFDAQGREAGRLAGPAEWDAPEAVKLLRDLAEPARP